MTLCPNKECSYWALGECQHGIFSQFDIPIQACERWQAYGMIHRQGPKVKPSTAFKPGHNKKPLRQEKLGEIGS